MSMLGQALSGVKVLDFSQGIAGPHGACLLAEMGAQVIKIEPPSGDWLRGLGVKRGGSSVLFGIFNRGKQGVSLDLKDEVSREAARILIADADVLIESNRPGVMRRLGLDYASLLEVNPKLIYVSVTGFGQEGPYIDRPATDAAIQAYTGFSFAASDMLEPIRVRVSLVDIITGIYVSQATLGALFQRVRSGKGQYLDISLMHSITAVQGYKYAEHELTGGTLRKELFAAIGMYSTADGHIALSAMREQQVLDLISVIHRDDILLDGRFATAEARFQNQDALRQVISERLASEKTGYWLPRMQEFDIICQEVLTYSAYRDDPHVLARQLFQSADLDDIGHLHTVRMPGLLASEALQSPPPKVGQHTVEILKNAGLDSKKLAAVLNAAA
ncbi:CoA transferase [Pollutimonas bauzanensis]|uniref:CaiB/BaiF CoA transferase family protein n=1 Tax=Pollutimonas bauzanensis TaxID=658167 RepID=UPI003340C6A3